MQTSNESEECKQRQRQRQRSSKYLIVSMLSLIKPLGYILALAPTMKASIQS